MVKACSLDFINKTEFDTDILSANGDILFSYGDAVTPELLLKLYFKDIFVPKKLEFDDEHAKKVQEYSVLIAKLLQLPEGRIEDLKTAAYYHDIGRTKFTESDVKKFDFARWQGEAGTNILANERCFPKEIAEVASLQVKPYNSARFPLIKEEKKNIPFAHIVAIANAYEELRNQRMSKKDALKKMAEMGGDKFNVFILHKFIKAMRESDGEHK